VGRPILITGMARSGGSWVSRMVAASGELVHINEPFNRRHPPGLTPGVLRVPPPRAYQYVGPHNEAEHVAGFRDMLRLRYNVGAELKANRGAYDLAKMAKYVAAFSHGRARGLRPLVDDPYMVFAAEWMAERLDCQVVMLVRHPAGVISSLTRIGTGWSDNLPDIAAQPELVRAYLAPYADELERAAHEPLDPIGHGALLWRLVHAGIARQVERNPRFIVIRYEDLAADPLAGFQALYGRLDGIPFTRAAERAVRRGCLAGPAQRTVPWGRVGLGRTAFQPMQSAANAWAWRDRLTAAQIAEVVERTRDVAQAFYSATELEGRAPRPGPEETPAAPRPALVARRQWRSA
jgi:Sulfotransferase family